MPEKPLVSVIVPSYNYADIIDGCIDSVIAQSFTNWELVICDDLSQDNSIEVLHRYANHPQIQVFVNDCNLGIFGNLTQCIERTQGRFIKILMADDWLHPQYLNKKLEAFEKYPSIGLCSTWAEVIRSNGKPIIRMDPETGCEFYPKEEMLRWVMRDVNPIGNPSRLMFRREAYEQVTGFDLDIEYCTDLDLWVRMLEYWDIGFIPEVLIYERLHPQNATKSYVADARHLTTGEQMLVKLYREHGFFKEHWWRQQRIWLFGWKEYWEIALRHMLEGHYQEIKALVKILWRRAFIGFWGPLLIWRFLHVSIRKSQARLVQLIENRQGWRSFALKVTNYVVRR